jgi:GT2 family glycosyltransferase
VPDRSQGRELGPLDLIGRALGLKRLLRFSAVQRLVTRGSLRDHVARIPDGPTEVASLAATAVLVRRTAFEAVGGFDESYFLYGEDLDLCRRLRAAGWRLVALPVVWARHRNGFSCGNWVTRELHWWRGTLMFAARWWGRRRWTLAMPAAAAMLVRIAIVAPREAVDAYRALIIDPRAARRTARH